MRAPDPKVLSAQAQAVESYINDIRYDSPQWFLRHCLTDAQRIASVFGIEQGTQGTLLDVGCGGGWIDIGLALVSKLDFVCVDIAPRCVRNTTSNFKDFYLGDRACVMQADALDLPFADNSFDYVMSTSSIGFWHNPQTGIEELYRVLKPGGRVFIRGFDGNRYSSFWQVLLDTGIERFEMTRAHYGPDSAFSPMSYISIWKPEEVS